VHSGDSEIATASVIESPSSQQKSQKHPFLRFWYAFCLVLAVVTYFYALDSLHIPKNGDEYVYTQITRLTAESGHLLPLLSHQVDMRNTKPPLLFWQGIASSDWAKDWTLFRLRYPSVLYTLLTALMAFLLAGKMSSRVETAVLAPLIYLSFFNVYRYGRPFLTEAPMSFWTFLPVFISLFWQPASMPSSVLVPVLLGLVLGVALLYKSFVLVLPISLTFAWWYLNQRGYRIGPFLKRDAWKVAITAVVALAAFCIWFLLDPKPMEVFQEFVLTENVGRFDVGSSSYLHYFFWGFSSIWGLALGYPVNSGLLIFPVFAVFWLGFKRRHNLDPGEKFLWILAASFFLIFSLPSMRSNRYLLPVMPGIAVLCALSWERISRKAFVATVLAATATLALLAYLCVRLQFSLGGAHLFPVTYWMLLAFTLIIVFLTLIFPDFTRHGVLAAALLVCLCLAAALRPLDGPLGHFAPDAQQYAAGKQVWVPCNFRAVDEVYRFLLPGADVHCYPDEKSVTFQSLDTRYAMFAIRQPLSTAVPSGLHVIGERLELRGRHTNRELIDMLRGNVFNQLFLREFLVEVPGGQPLGEPTVDHR
jgi:Dolichyl-phosphate-mannose-protein mannosyltransferase